MRFVFKLETKTYSTKLKHKRFRSWLKLIFYYQIQSKYFLLVFFSLIYVMIWYSIISLVLVFGFENLITCFNIQNTWNIKFSIKKQFTVFFT